MTSYEGLCEILAKDYQLAPESLTPATLLKSLEIDSLGIIELIFAIEEKFSVIANDADTDSAKDFLTLGDVAAYIDRLIERRDAPTPESVSTTVQHNVAPDVGVQ